MAVVDADVWGFSIPRMLGVDRPPVIIDEMLPDWRERVFAELTRDPSNEYLMLDATLVKAHQQAATGRGGAKRGVPRTRLWGVPEVD